MGSLKVIIRLPTTQTVTNSFVRVINLGKKTQSEHWTSSELDDEIHRTQDNIQAGEGKGTKAGDGSGSFFFFFGPEDSALKLKKDGRCIEQIKLQTCGLFC